MNQTTSGSLQSYAHSVLRIVAGFTFTLHGLQKLFGMFGGMGGGGVKAQFISLPWVAAVLEAFGGLLIVVGLFGSIVAFILCGEMAVAYFMVHFPQGFWPIQNGGELAVLYCFVFLYLSAAGSGRWSLDQLMRKKAT